MQHLNCYLDRLGAAADSVGWLIEVMNEVTAAGEPRKRWGVGLMLPGDDKLHNLRVDASKEVGQQILVWLRERVSELEGALASVPGEL
jgi:hypothetical protein